jgi:hypothetical protein
MKRCPKCNRTFPDENQKFCTFDGGLLIAQPAFDPNVTIRATAAEVELPPSAPPRPAKSTSRELPNIERASNRRDFNPDQTIAASAPTAFFPRSTSASGNQTSANLPPPPPPPVNIGVTTASSRLPQPVAPAMTVTAPTKSKLPWILGALLLLLLLGGGGLAALFFVVVKPRLEQMSQPRVERETPRTITTEQPNANMSPETSPAEEAKTPETPVTDTYVPPADAKRFASSKEKLDGKLAEQYVDFYFYYPGSWQTDPKAGVRGASNFARVFKSVKDDAGDYTPESVAVSWYTSNGTYDSDVSVFPSRVQALSAQLAKSLPDYRKVSEGPTDVNSLRAYQFYFTGVSNETDQGELPYWGRVIFIPPGVEGQKTGITIIMLATSRAEGINKEDDIGVKGEMPIILESFRFGRKE